MNVAYFIIQLLHICNLLALYVMTPLCSPCTPSVDYAYLFTNYDNTFGDYIDFSTDCAHNFNDCANTLDDRMNVVADSANMPNISSLDFNIPNLTVLQLLFICRSKIKTMFTVESMIYSLSSTFFIYGFYISHLLLSSSMLEFAP
jgi:hypothetical protein